MKATTLFQSAIARGVATIAFGAVVSTSAFVPTVQAQSTIKIDGSSTVFPIMEVAASEFQKTSGTRVTVGVSGTGGGFRKFCSGELDISNASRPIVKKEMEACRKNGVKFIEIPIAYDGLAVVVNPANTWAKDLTVAELKKIWEPGSKINNWSQVRAGFPNVPLKLFGAGSASGTFDYFTEAINGKSKATRTDYTPSEDDNVLVQGVSRDRGAMGYFGKAYLESNKTRVKAVAIRTAAGKPAVLPTNTTVANATYQPLSRPMFLYVNVNAAKRPEVKSFITYIYNNGPSIVTRARYTPFSSVNYRTLLLNFNRGKQGTVFGGEQEIGLTINEMIRRETKS